MKKYVFTFISLAVLIFIGVLFLTGNRKTVNNDTDMNIVTSFYPTYYFTSKIVGDTMRVENIGRNNDPHEFMPSAKDILKMQGADLVVLQGGGLESWGKDVKEQLKNVGVPVFVVNEHLPLYKTEEGINHGGYDPHTWLDPVLALETVKNLKKEIESINPPQSTLYDKNAGELIIKLENLNKLYSKDLDSAHCSIDKALISHDALGYIARRYGLHMLPIAGISTQDRPSAKLLTELKEQAKRNGVIAVLTEENSVKEYAQTIANKTGIMMLQINALPTGVVGGDYMDGMRNNLNNLIKAYGCNK